MSLVFPWPLSWRLLLLSLFPLFIDLISDSNCWYLDKIFGCVLFLSFFWPFWIAGTCSSYGLPGRDRFCRSVHGIAVWFSLLRLPHKLHQGRLQRCIICVLWTHLSLRTCCLFKHIISWQKRRNVRVRFLIFSLCWLRLYYNSNNLTTISNTGASLFMVRYVQINHHQLWL